MKTKELLQALLDGKPIANEKWENDYIFLNEEDDNIYYHCVKTNEDSAIDSIKFGEYLSHGDFVVRLLTNQERTFLKTYLDCYKNKNRVKYIKFTDNYIELINDDGYDIEDISRSKLNLKFDGIAKYANYELWELELK